MTPARTNQNWLPGIFNEILGDNWLAERRSTTAPAVNIIDGENEYKVEVAAPGMTKEDFKVHINEDNELVIWLGQGWYKRGTVGIISTDDSTIKVLRIPTNEELPIARDTLEIVSKL